MISIDNLKLRVHSTPLHHEVDVRITPDGKNLCEARIWYNGRLTDVYRLKTADLKGVHF
ncbi:MAG TPA: hypothetical protein VKF36_11315 [Syntrophorhabdales bacterium]|nr:hypothetical protein [Syntrophorhabdales bacterium]